jgi:hypothetical protein
MVGLIGIAVIVLIVIFSIFYGYGLFLKKRKHGRPLGTEGEMYDLRKKHLKRKKWLKGQSALKSFITFVGNASTPCT